MGLTLVAFPSSTFRRGICIFCSGALCGGIIGFFIWVAFWGFLWGCGADSLRFVGVVLWLEFKGPGSKIFLYRPLSSWPSVCQRGPSAWCQGTPRALPNHVSSDGSDHSPDIRRLPCYPLTRICDWFWWKCIHFFQLGYVAHCWSGGYCLRCSLCGHGVTIHTRQLLEWSFWPLSHISPYWAQCL